MEFFDTKKGLILVKVTATGITRTEDAWFALDTGASTTVINRSLLQRIGYTGKDFSNSIFITTGSGKEKTAILPVKKIVALGQTRTKFRVLGFQLPPTTFIDGLLGLDFMRKRKITIDFISGRIELANG
ncbi:MAG: retropepsin-like aspartic protease [Bacteroidota bacterium]